MPLPGRIRRAIDTRQLAPAAEPCDCRRRRESPALAVLLAGRGQARQVPQPWQCAPSARAPSRLTLTSFWSGDTPLTTRSPSAASSTLDTKRRTTGSDTSASSSARLQARARDRRHVLQRGMPARCLAPVPGSGAWQWGWPPGWQGRSSSTRARTGQDPASYAAVPCSAWCPRHREPCRASCRG